MNPSECLYITPIGDALLDILKSPQEKPDQSPLHSATPRAVRAELADTIEDIGSALTLLREAIDDTNRGNLDAGKMCASDALELLSSLEATFSRLSAKLALWSEHYQPEDQSDPSNPSISQP